jgi:AmmeMemoRadiSam system protein A
MDPEDTSGKLPKKIRDQLLSLARDALRCAGEGKALPPLDIESLPELLKHPGASFVTLTRNNALRGCIGALAARLPLAEDVRQHAFAAALHDLRFPPVTEGEVDSILIEVSILTQPEKLEYVTPEDLLSQISPGRHGVIISEGERRATFLPQVWERIPTPSVFLSMLCEKAGLKADHWQWGHPVVQVYEVVSFQENEEDQG